MTQNMQHIETKTFGNVNNVSINHINKFFVQCAVNSKNFCKNFIFGNSNKDHIFHVKNFATRA